MVTLPALIGGIGTVVDMVASLVQSVVARKLEAMAVKANTQAHVEQTAVIKGSTVTQDKSTKSLGKLVGALGIVAIAFTIVSSAAKYLSSKLRAEADEMGKVSEAFIARLEDGQDVGAGLANTELKRIDKESSAQAIEQGNSTGTIATGIAAALTVLGVAIGVITIPITAVGLAITAVVIAVIGLVAGLAGWKLSLWETADANQKQRDAVIASTKGFCRFNCVPS